MLILEDSRAPVPMNFSRMYVSLRNRRTQQSSGLLDLLELAAQHKFVDQFQFATTVADRGLFACGLVPPRRCPMLPHTPFRL